MFGSLFNSRKKKVEAYLDVPLDYEQLRKDLIDDSYALVFGAGLPEGFVEVAELENANALELLKIAVDRGFNLDKYR